MLKPDILFWRYSGKGLSSPKALFATSEKPLHSRLSTHPLRPLPMLGAHALDIRCCTPFGTDLTAVLRAPRQSSPSGQIWRCGLPGDRRTMCDDAMTHATHGLKTSAHAHAYQTSQPLQSAEGRHARPFSAWTPRRRPPPEGQDRQMRSLAPVMCRF